MARAPHRGKYRRMRLFVMTLGYSRKSVRLLVFHSSTQTWAELHEQAFRRLGGCTRVVVLDRKSTRLNSSHLVISYAVVFLEKQEPIATRYRSLRASLSFSRAHVPHTRA